MHGKTHGVLEVTRGDQLGDGELVIYFDPDKKMKLIARAGAWFREPARAVRAAEHRRRAEIRRLQEKMEETKALKFEIRAW